MGGKEPEFLEGADREELVSIMSDLSQGILTHSLGMWKLERKSEQVTRMTARVSW